MADLPITPETYSNRDTNPFYGFEKIPNQSSDYEFTSKNIRGFNVTAAGNIKIDMPANRSPITFYAPLGLVKAVRATKIYSTANGTSATVTEGME